MHIVIILAFKRPTVCSRNGSEKVQNMYNDGLSLVGCVNPVLLLQVLNLECLQMVKKLVI